MNTINVFAMFFYSPVFPTPTPTLTIDNMVRVHATIIMLTGSNDALQRARCVGGNLFSEVHYGSRCCVSSALLARELLEVCRTDVWDGSSVAVNCNLLQQWFCSVAAVLMGFGTVLPAGLMWTITFCCEFYISVKRWSVWVL